MTLRPCLGCGGLTRGSRCSPCDRAHRGSRQERGYDAAWDALSREIIKQSGGICHWCGGVATTTDHVVPKALGGNDDPANLVAACVPCNSGRTANVTRS